jgi:hypothetical protein
LAALIPAQLIGGNQVSAAGPSYATSLSQLIGPDGPPQGPNNTAAASATPEGTPALPVATVGSEPVGVEFHPTTAPAGVNPLDTGCYDIGNIRNAVIGGSNNYIGGGAFGFLREAVGAAGADIFTECNYLDADYLTDNTINPNGYVDFLNESGQWLLNAGATSGNEDFFNGIDSGSNLKPCWNDVTGWDGGQVYDPAPGGVDWSEVLVGGFNSTDVYSGLKTGSPWSGVGLCS